MGELVRKYGLKEGDTIDGRVFEAALSAIAERPISSPVDRKVDRD